MRRAPAAALALAAALVFATVLPLGNAGVARADEPVAVPYQLHLDVDLGLFLGGLVLWGGTSFVAGSAPPSWCGTAATPPCDPSGLNALDRTAVGLWNPKARIAADAITGIVPGALTLFDILDAGVVKNWRGWMADAVVISEAVVWDGAVQDIVRRAVRRPRPYMYTPGVNPTERDGPEANFSFFSGHTSGTFAMATAVAMTYSLRHPRSRWQALVWTLALAGATTEPVLRVLSGDHFPVDCVVGALVGSASGVLFPALHRKKVPIRFVSSVSADRTVVGVAGSF